MSWRTAFAAAAVVALLGASLLAALAVGRYPITPATLLAILREAIGGGDSSVDPTARAVLWQIRAPRIAAALAVGAALAASGAAYQALFRNPLVSPDILGVSAGAALGAVVGIFLALDAFSIQALAFAGGLLAVATAWALAASLRGHDPIVLVVLAGVAISALLGAGVAMLKYLADPYDQLPAITYWLLGSLAAATRVDVASVLPALLAGTAAMALLRWRITVLSLGDEEAEALGVRAPRVRAAVIAAATLMTAAAVSISGIVGWVGLIVPHIARLLVGPSFARLLPASLMLGGTFLLAVDTLARTIAAVELPLGVLTALVGTPLFLWLLASARRGWQ